jgi:molybdopterin-guanine dinucleotide biosynthesis protein A
MGQDKALIEVDGRPLALRVADSLLTSCGAVSIVGDPLRYAKLGLPVVSDNFPGEGPLAGIEAALRATSADWNLIAACDMPSLDSAVFASLFSMGCDCAAPRYADGNVEPLCSVYHRRCHGAVLAALEFGIRRVTDALRRLESEGFSVGYVTITDHSPFRNLNTPEELRSYRNA